ncbi:winged helix-turn-helix transcriptional regulator, partial [Agrobacterium tumefaciens]|uniref:winged helix-turn-helix transcriptional regulator n=1 Tax=Agrobacterium tumefaciens TaxID=358 RepID=UPI0012D3665A
LFPASKPKSGRNSTYPGCAVFPSQLSIREIAAHVNLSPRTVEHRLERLRAQIGARSLTHLAAMFVVAGFDQLLDFDPNNRPSS